MVLGGVCGAVSLRAAVQIGLRGSCGAVVLVYILDNNPQTSQPSLWFQQLLAGDEDASLVVLNVEYSDVLYTYSTDLEGYLSSASQVIDDINDNNLVEKDPIQSFDINDLDLTNNLYYKLDRGQLSKSLFFGKGASLIVAR